MLGLQIGSYDILTIAYNYCSKEHGSKFMYDSSLYLTISIVFVSLEFERKKQKNKRKKFHLDNRFNLSMQGHTARGAKGQEACQKGE